MAVTTRRGVTGDDLDTRDGITAEEKREAEAELDRLEREGLIWKGRLDEIDEGQRLLANPEFRAAIQAGRKSRAGRNSVTNRHVGKLAVPATRKAPR